jgi:hypothetical protein
MNLQPFSARILFSYFMNPNSACSINDNIFSCRTLSLASALPPKPILQFTLTVSDDSFMKYLIIESFNAGFRLEYLTEHWFMNLEHARGKTEEWRRDCKWIGDSFFRAARSRRLQAQN